MCAFYNILCFYYDYFNKIKINITTFYKEDVYVEKHYLTNYKFLEYKPIVL